MTARQKRVKQAVEYLTRYMDTYDKQPGYLDYEDKTIIDDVLYALGVGLGGEKYRWADGFKRFKAYLAKHISDGMTGDGHVRKAYVLYRKTGCVPLKKGPFLSDSQVEKTLIEMLRSCPEADEYMVAKVTHDHDVWICTAGDFLSRQEAKRSAETTVGEDIAPADGQPADSEDDETLQLRAFGTLPHVRTLRLSGSKCDVLEWLDSPRP